MIVDFTLSRPSERASFSENRIPNVSLVCQLVLSTRPISQRPSDEHIESDEDDQERCRGGDMQNREESGFVAINPFSAIPEDDEAEEHGADLEAAERGYSTAVCGVRVPRVFVGRERRTPESGPGASNLVLR